MAMFKITAATLAVLTCILDYSVAQFYGPPKATKEVAGIEAKDVIVECYQRGVKVIIEKARFPRIRSSEKLHFLDPVCIAGENETHFIASTTYRACGVSRKVQWNGLVYSNTLMTGFPDTDDFDHRCPVVSIKFTCVHSFFVWPKPRMTRAVSKSINCEHIVALGPKIKQGIFSRTRVKSSGIRMKSRVLSCPMLIGVGPPVRHGEFARVSVTSKAIKVKRTHAFICKKVEGKGQFNLQLKAYSDEGFSKEIGKILETPELTVDVYYELKLMSRDSLLMVYPKKCYATPTKDRSHSVQYVFLKDGCFLDETVQVYSSEKNAFRFSIKTFVFVGVPDAMFYVHCDVSICDVEDEESPCAKGCISGNVRQKRSRRRKVKTGFTKSCKFDSIEISIERSLLRRASQTNLQLEDPNCIAKANATHFSFSIYRGKCGTLVKATGSIVEISNTVNYRVGGSEVFSVPVKCKFSEKVAMTSASRSLQIAHRERFVSISISQSYHLNKKVTLDPSVSEVYSKVPLEIEATETDGILEVSVQPHSADLYFVIDHCKIKPSPTSRTKRILIEHDCSMDENAHLMKSNMSAKMYFDFQRWKKPGKRMFAKCHFTVCHKNSPTSKCQKRICHNEIAVLTNGGRKKRSAVLAGVISSVSCQPDKISIAIEKSSVPMIEAADLHLKDKGCQARENKTHIILETKPYGCRTSVRSFGSAIEYTNVVQKRPALFGGIIHRISGFRIPFKCIFMPFKSRQLRPVFKTKDPVVKFSGISTGTYPVRIRMFTDPTYTTEMDSLNAQITPRSDMYFEVAMASPNASMIMYLEVCYGKPFYSTDSMERYEFIKDNCPVDDTVLFYRTERNDQKRFSVSPFEFSDAHYKSVFVNCIVSACDPNETKSRCFKTCPNTPLPL